MQLLPNLHNYESTYATPLGYLKALHRQFWAAEAPSIFDIGIGGTIYIVLTSSHNVTLQDHELVANSRERLC